MSMRSEQEQPGRRWYRMAAAVAAAVILVSGGILAGAWLTRDAAEQPPGSVQASPSATTPTETTGTASPAHTTTTPTGCPTEQPRPFAYQPLWPFTSQSKAAAWQAAYRSSGHQPWHLDAVKTASYFTLNYLGFTEINEVIRHDIRGDHAWVSVGYTTEDVIEPYVAATIHLVKYGSGRDAPWEVVGTRDTDLTLTTPKYGAVVGSPVKAGGRISGVDESIILEVRQASSQQPLGTSEPVPAGGQRQPWQSTVSFRGTTDPVLTLVARTGGHYREVERFAVTAIRPD